MVTDIIIILILLSKHWMVLTKLNVQIIHGNITKKSVSSTVVVQYNKRNEMSCTYFPDRFSWSLSVDTLDVPLRLQSRLPPPI